MSTQYTLRVKNNSTLHGSVCVYQKEPAQMLNQNLYSVAWFSKDCFPNTQLTFRWTIDYSLTWSETGLLLPGGYFDASEVWPADPGNPANNAVTLSRTGNAYHFIPPTKASAAGSMSIYTDNTIPTAGVSIGVGVSGQTAFACQATPNFDFTFMPHPEYWVAFGDFTEGEVLDVNKVSHSYKVQFPVNMYSMSLSFNPDNIWSESNQLQTNDILRMAKTFR